MKLIITSALSLLLVSAAGCSKKSDCEAVYDHTVSILPAEMKASMGDAGKDKALAKCEKMSPEARACALEAKSLEDLAGCARK